ALRIDVDTPLGAFGMDSLMAIRIRRRCEQEFGTVLAATALFSYPSVSALTGLLMERLGLEVVTDATIVERSSGTSAVEHEVNALTDDQALAALRARHTTARRESA
ncbi:MAG: acyl carrier protein, partial [Gemmatimonadaceae bacterium]